MQRHTLPLSRIIIACTLGALLAASCHAADLPSTLPPHPRLLFSKTDLPAIRQRAAGTSKSHFESLKRQADDWLKTEIKLPDRGGQWFHWYSCPKHGARLRTEGPTRHVCPVDGQVFTGYPYDDVVLSGEHNRLAAAVRSLGIVYQITGDKAYAAKARDILLAYAAKYRSYPLHNTRGEPKVGGGKVGPQTLDESTWLITVVEGADCVWDSLSPSEQKDVTENLLRPATQVIRDHKMGIHNIQCWKNSAVGLTGLLLGDTNLIHEALDADAGYYNQLKKGVTADGPWFEGAWGYHFYTLSAVLHLTEGAFHSGINLYGPELKRMLDAPIDMAMPNLTLPAFNDSQTVDLAGSANLYDIALARYHDTRYELLAGRRDSDAALLQGARPTGQRPPFVPATRNFPASGNAILAAGTGQNATWLGIKYGPHGGGHGHPDKLNFVLYGSGEVIAPDPGTANYGVPIQAGWFRTTLAHNTLTIDEESQKPAEGKCLAFISTNGFSAITADAGNIAPGVHFTRTVALIGDKLLVFLDQVRADKEHTFDLAWHNRGTFTAPENAADFRAPQKPGYSYLRDTKSLTTSSGLRLSFDTGQSKVLWVMAPGENTTFITGTGVGKHTEDRVPLILARRKATQTTYAWAVSLDGNSQTLEVTHERLSSTAGADVAAVRVRSGSDAWVLVANPSETPAKIGPVQVSGKIALLSSPNGTRPALKYTAQ